MFLVDNTGKIIEVANTEFYVDANGKYAELLPAAFYVDENGKYAELVGGASKIYIQALYLNSSGEYYAHQQLGMFCTENNFETLTQLSNGLVNGSYQVWCDDVHSYQYNGVDYLVTIYYSPATSNHTSDIGIRYSTDGGKTWTVVLSYSYYHSAPYQRSESYMVIVNNTIYIVARQYDSSFGGGRISIFKCSNTLNQVSMLSLSTDISIGVGEMSDAVSLNNSTILVPLYADTPATGNRSSFEYLYTIDVLKPDSTNKIPVSNSGILQSSNLSYVNGSPANGQMRQTRVITNDTHTDGMYITMFRSGFTNDNRAEYKYYLYYGSKLNTKMIAPVPFASGFIYDLSVFKLSCGCYVDGTWVVAILYDTTTIHTYYSTNRTSWTRAADVRENTYARLDSWNMSVFDGVIYFTIGNRLWTSEDKGKTWSECKILSDIYTNVYLTMTT